MAGGSGSRKAAGPPGGLPADGTCGLSLPAGSSGAGIPCVRALGALGTLLDSAHRSMQGGSFCTFPARAYLLSCRTVFPAAPASWAMGVTVKLKAARVGGGGIGPLTAQNGDLSDTHAAAVSASPTCGAP